VSHATNPRKFVTRHLTLETAHPYNRGREVRKSSKRRGAMGEVVKVERVNGYEVVKVVDRVAYPQNGNAHNPTVYYQWHLLKGGKLLDRFFRYREARKAALNDDYAEDAGKPLIEIL
jgi:hypothetical protein